MNSGFERRSKSSIIASKYKIVDLLSPLESGMPDAKRRASILWSIFYLFRRLKKNCVRRTLKIFLRLIIFFPKKPVFFYILPI